MGLYTDKVTVFDESRFSYQNDFPYQHPLVSIGSEIEPAVDVYKFDNAEVNLGLNKAFKVDGAIVKQLSSNQGADELNKRKKVEKKKGRFLDLVTPGANLYSHWLLDLMPKIRALEKAGYDISSFDYIYVNYFNSGFKRECFEKIGIDPERVVDFSSHPKIFRAKEIVTVSRCRSALFTPSWVSDYIQSIFLSGNVEGEFDKVYISRSMGNTRRILNEGKLLEILIPLGFKIIYCESQTVEATARIMRSARYVVSSHGAGLANIVFCKSGTSILELFSSHISSEYYKLSKRFGFNYSALQVEDFNKSLRELESLDYKANRPEIHGANLLLSDDSLKSIKDWLNNNI